MTAQADMSCINQDDLLAERKTGKSRLLASILDKPFHELGRRLRLEALALDGAMVLDHNGFVVAAGAILEVSAGSRGGGREAAARELSKRGMGIKVSADGPIRVMKDEEVVFVT